MWYLVLVAVVNLGLGAALARYVRGPLRAREAARVIYDSRRATIDLDLGPPASGSGATTSPVDELPEEEFAQLDDAIKSFEQELSDFRGKIGELNSEAKQCAASPNSESFHQCLDGLKSANEEYLQKQDEHRKHHEAVPNNHPVLRQVSDRVHRAMDEQTATVRQSSASLEAISEGDLAINSMKLAEQSEGLAAANERLGNTLGESTAELSTAANLSGAVQEEYDPLSSLATKEALEEAFAKWCSDRNDREGPLSLAVIDLDRFAGIAERLEPAASTSLLQAIAQFVHAGTSKGGLAARLTGESFALLLPGIEPSVATNDVERIRQNIEATQFALPGEEIDLTASCAVIGALDGDTAETLLDRAKTTLEEARRYGRNRTFLHEGKYPAPVVPTDLSVEHRVVPI